MSNQVGAKGSGKVGSRERLVSNSKWNLLAFSVNIAVNFLTIPYVIYQIGLTAFGGAGLIISMLAPFMLIGIVLGQATVRELSPRYAQDDYKGANRVFSAAIVICAIAAVVFGVFFAIVGGLVLHELTDQKLLLLDWRAALLIAATGWIAQQLTLVVQGTVAATQNYYSLARISVVASIINASTIILVVELYPTTIGYLSGMAIGFCFALLVWALLARQNYPWLFPLSRKAGAELRLLLRFGKWQSVAHFAGAFGNQMDRYVLGALAPLSVVGLYNIAMRLQEVAYASVLKSGEVLFPHFSATVGEPVARRADFFISASWVLNTIAVCALVPLIPLSESIISLWVNPEAAEGAASILRVLATAGIIGCAVNVYLFHSMGTGENVRLAALYVINAILTTGFTVLLIGLYGPPAAGFGILLAATIQLGTVIYLSRKSFADVFTFTKLVHCTLSPLWSGLVLAWFWFRSAFFIPSGWISLAFVFMVISFSVLLGSVTVTAATRDGRTMLIRVYRIAKRGLLKKD